MVRRVLTSARAFVELKALWGGITARLGLHANIFVINLFSRPSLARISTPLLSDLWAAQGQGRRLPQEHYVALLLCYCITFTSDLYAHSLSLLMLRAITASLRMCVYMCVMCFSFN